MATTHFASPGDTSGSLIVLYYITTYLLVSTQIFYEVTSNGGGHNVAGRESQIFGNAAWFSDVSIIGANGEVTLNLRDFFMNHIGGPYVRFSIRVREPDDTMQVIYAKRFNRSLSSPPIIHGDETERIKEGALIEDDRRVLFPKSHKRDKAMGMLIATLIVISETTRGNLNGTDILTLIISPIFFTVGLPRAYAVIFHHAKPTIKYALKRAKVMNEIIEPYNPYKHRETPYYLNVASIRNSRAISAIRHLFDLSVIKAEKDTGLFMSLGMAVSLLSLATAAAVIFVFEDIESAIFDKFFIFFSFQAVYGLVNNFPVLTLAIKHNKQYNKVFASTINDKIVDITNVMTMSSVSTETREEMRNAVLVLKAIHNNVVEHPTM